MYRSPSKPKESKLFIRLAPFKGRRVILAGGMWFLGIWFLIYPVYWVVHALVTGEMLWRLLIAPPLWFIVPWGITRTMRMETLLLGTRSLRRIGWLRDHTMEWSVVTGVRAFERARRKGRPIPLIAVQGEGRELIIAPYLAQDPQRVMSWALEQATQGRVAAIDERVRHEGKPVRRALWYRAHVITGLVFSVLVGWFFVVDLGGREAERVLRGIDSLPEAQQLQAAAEIYNDDGLSDSVRCRAGSKMKWRLLRHGDLSDAVAQCRGMSQVCRHDSDCSGIVALRDAHAAFASGNYTGTLELLQGSDINVPIRYAIEVQSLVATQRLPEAREKSAECLHRYEGTESARTRELIGPCRDLP